MVRHGDVRRIRLISMSDSDEARRERTWRIVRESSKRHGMFWTLAMRAVSALLFVLAALTSAIEYPVRFLIKNGALLPRALVKTSSPSRGARPS